MEEGRGCPSLNLAVGEDGFAEKIEKRVGRGRARDTKLSIQLIALD